MLQIDVSLEWDHVNAGQIICRQNDAADSIYVVLSGRLRSILEGDVDPDTTGEERKHVLKRGESADGLGLSLLSGGPNISTNYFEILAEYGQNESVGELEVLTGMLRYFYLF